MVILSLVFIVFDVGSYLNGINFFLEKNIFFKKKIIYVLKNVVLKE